MESKKIENIDPNKRSAAIKMIGITASLSLILILFEAVSVDINPGAINLVDKSIVDEKVMEAQIIQPLVPPPPIVPVIDVVIEKEDDKKIKVVDLGSQDKLNDKIVDIAVAPEKEKPEIEEIFTVVEKMPEFEGGQAELYEYLRKNTKYPQLAKEQGVKGKVFVEFIVEKDGSISNVKLIRGIGSGCDEEGIRVVKNMPKWSPGEQRGKAVRVKFTLPILYRLQ